MSDQPFDDAGVLHSAVTDAAIALADVIGFHAADEIGPDTPRVMCLVDRDRVPAYLWNAAVAAYDYLTVAVSLAGREPVVGDMDADLAALDPRNRQK